MGPTILPTFLHLTKTAASSQSLANSIWQTTHGRTKCAGQGEHAHSVPDVPADLTPGMPRNMRMRMYAYKKYTYTYAYTNTVCV